ncbi:MAG: hypothetical protein WKG07_35355 [Hymenobacter sp.]
MSALLIEIDQALADFQARHAARPVAVYLGERKFTQLVLDVAQQGAPPTLSTGAGRPLTYRNLELLRERGKRGRAPGNLSAGSSLRTVVQTTAQKTRFTLLHSSYPRRAPIARWNALIHRAAKLLVAARSRQGQ